MDGISNLNKIGEGQESEVFSLEDNRVMKLFRNSEDDKLAFHEMEVLKTIDKIGISVPKVYEYICIGGRPGYIMEQAYGNSIVSIIEKKPYLTIRLSKIFGKSHWEINKIDAPIEIRLLKEGLKKGIKSVNCLDDEIIEYTLKLLSELPNGNSVCHGDYNPSNVIINSTKTVFLDWGGVRKGDPTADVAHTLLILKNGQFPPNTPRILKIIFRLGRRTFADVYFRTYIKYNPIDLSILSKWEMVRAVGRLEYGGAQERPALLKFIKNYYNNRDKDRIILF